MIKRTYGVIALTIAISPPVFTQEDGRIQLGNFDLIPELNSQLSYIDNVTYASDGEESISSWRSIVAPELNAITRFSTHELGLAYRIERGDYFDSDADNYTDHLIRLYGDFEFGSRHRFDAIATYEDGHDERGRRYSNGNARSLTEVDTWNNSGIDGVYSFGALSARGRLDLKAGYSSLDYDKGIGTYLFRDRDYTDIGAAFAYKIGGHARAVIEIGTTDISYDNAADPSNPLDSVEQSVMAGVTWRASATTKGFAKAGYKEKDFDSALREDFSGAEWEVGVKWSPLTYSHFELATSTDTRETTSDADFIETRDYRATWNHEWVERFSTKTAFVYFQDEYVGPPTAERTDDVTRVDLSADYQFRRWLLFGIFYQFSNRDSDREDVTFDRNVYGISARVTL
ncbi:outer membrane beta-barrel protein [Alteromonas sp. ASW11-130]|uniref:outer membrane beta-barrel protein n=1 Tax=Alteromonas sp. ASW11-130 TaxID=3015775 RepID=UPI0022426D9A|nr:outer membrane beta-barrel protein [Alteromonas sp. ASW11-130]MCW8090407.1 outer membrane beta-barrel protein [Alteromonas sp. ASW11-130]